MLQSKFENYVRSILYMVLRRTYGFNDACGTPERERVFKIIVSMSTKFKGAGGEDSGHID